MALSLFLTQGTEACQELPQPSCVQSNLQVHTGDYMGSVSTLNVGKSPFLQFSHQKLFS